jgi:hypothetical protein
MKFSAEAVLHVMMGAYLAGVAGVAAVGYLATQDAQEQAMSAQRASADIGMALGLARSADAQAAKARGEGLRKTLEDAQQLLARNKLDASPLAPAIAAATTEAPGAHQHLQRSRQRVSRAVALTLRVRKAEAK